MPNPWTRSAATSFLNGPGGGGTDVLSTLPAGQAKGLGSVSAPGTTPPAGDWEVGALSVTIPATTGGNVDLFLLSSTDGTHWAGNIDPTSTSNQATAVTAAIAADPNFGPTETLTIPSGSGGIFAFRPFFLTSLLANVPTFWAVLVRNGTNVAFTASSALYRTDTYA
jgi:hypothetical protein